ncbi:galactose metabolism-related protein [Friedmanniomyces endolithicus]|nr:galactose metabolism-related protein [Friedmanniomyces endolithicus]KAK1811640.1 galactose metabolism-related protein [Friedmanniomyces endolithicus]
MGNSQSQNEESSSPASGKKAQHTQRAGEVSRDAWKHDVHSRAKSNYPPVPTATLLPTAPSTATSTSNVHVSRKTASSQHGRVRSTTSATPKLKAEESTSSQKSSIAAMGQTESKELSRPPSRSQTLSPTSSESQRPIPSPSSQPVGVPRAGEEYNEQDVFRPSGVPDESAFGLGASTRFDRPPRMPLPIEEELHTPGSPILSAMDLPLTQTDSEGVIPRRTSVLSSTTVDDDELADDMFANEAQSLAPTVPTLITWRGDSDKVYVTGTFVNWERKIKLIPDKEHGGYSAIVNLKPGTHHLKFMIRGDQTTCDDYPTTVDWAGNFVNYIEVVAPPAPVAEHALAISEPVLAPGTGSSAGAVTAKGEPAAARPIDIRTGTRASETLPSTPQGTAGHDGALSTARGGPHSSGLHDQDQERRPTAPPRQRVPRPKYTSEIPAFLLDLDGHNTDDQRSDRAKRVEQNLPQPPTLPMFLGKSILNGQMPHKDDASVLPMPNHTVLNHLATSSIKHGVLATSGTTRYKRKFLTTIMYKPTTTSDG